MADYTGTNVIAAKWKEGDVQKFVGTYTLGTTIAQNDTITWSNALPDFNGVTILDVQWVSPELDTNATPTGTVDIGDGTDQDGYIDGASLGIAAASLNQVIAKGNGALMGTAVTGTSIVATMPTAFATGASSGKIYLTVTYACGDIT